MSVKNMKAGPDMTTKMSEGIIQYQGNTFRGIEQVYVIPFSSDTYPAKVAPANSRLGAHNVKLDYPGISNNGLIANNNSRFFAETQIPIGMNSVLVYGKAPDVASSNIKVKKHTNGSLIPEGIADPSGSDDIFFHLDPILNTGDDDELIQINAKIDLLLNELNGIVSMMRSSDVSSILGIYDALKHECENQILSCSFSVFDRIRYDIQTALINLPYDTPIEKIEEINLAVDEFSTILRDNLGEDFPSSYGIPDGAIGFWWNGNEFLRLINGVNIALVDPASYCYPPSLWYYSNSSVLTSEKENTKSYYVPSNLTWNDILNKYNDGNIVKTETQGVAIVEPLQYGVGMLELSLNEPEAAVAAMVNNCPLTGIIIGDQKDVDFRFQPAIYPSAPNPGRYIYDNITGDLKIGATGKSAKTLVLQTQENAKVHFALEFENTTKTTLYCQQGDILPWCKFYLAGELDPTKNVTQPQGENIKSVFCQDHITTVTVTIKGLMSAYNTVPDLHDPQLEIGIIANMKWEQVTPQSITLKL